ncbi:MAG: hypothetical protein AB1Z98_08615 [Nannocystaceae bacterium]
MDTRQRDRRRRGVDWRARVLVGAALVSAGAGTSSCFDGASALGLPCGSDQDCGRDQRCEQGLCGGPPATSTAGSGSTSVGASSTSESSSTSDLDTTADSTGPQPSCGDGVLDPGEDCDAAGVDTVDCDADCTSTACGDGYANAAAGEDCDDGNEADADGCTSQCRAAVFWDDMEDPVQSQDKWSVQTPSYPSGASSYGLRGTDTWRLGLPGMDDLGVWHSGPYAEQSGTARLVSSPIVLPPEPGEGFRYQLRFSHSLRFDGNDVQDFECMGLPANGDGAVVWIDDGMMLRPLGPPMGEGSLLIPDDACLDPNPFLTTLMPPMMYGGLLGPSPIEQRLMIDDVGSRPFQLVFEIGYDCNNCWSSTPDASSPPRGWVLDDIVVAPFADGP